MNSPSVTFEVATRFESLRRRYIALRIITSASVTLAIAVLCWSILAIGDYIWEWPLLARRILAAVAAAGLLIYSAIQFLHLITESNAGRFASRLEQRFDSLGQRLRTVLEAVEGKLRAPEPMLSALGHQTLGRWETASPAAVLPLRTATAALAGVLVLLILGFAGIVVDPDWRTALLRGLGSERVYTAMEVSPGDTRLLEGSQIQVGLRLVGRTDRKVTLRYRQGEDVEWIESDLLPNDVASDQRHATFEAAIGKAMHPVEYQFVTSAGTTSLYRINVQPFIQVEKFETLVTPPEYTRLEPRTFNAAELTVLAGSRVSFSIGTNHPLAEAQLQVGDKVSSLEVVDALVKESPKIWTFELPSSHSVHWEFTGKGADGTPITPVKGRLRIRYDEQPRIEWRDPTEEIKVHMLAEVPMRAQVSDDYGLTEAGIIFQVGDEEEYVLKSWTQADAENASAESVTTQLRLEELLPLESLLLSERDFVTYYAYAVDNREGSMQRIETDMRYIDILPLRQFWSERESDPNLGGGGGMIPQLDELIRRQRFLINRTRRESRNQTADASNADLTEQLPKIERMVASQSELADLTRFLMDFLASQGNDDTEALGQAEAAMLQAVDSLTKADFTSALVQEEEAGRALAEARNSLEVTLSKNRTPQQSMQMRSFIRQMQQKLRRSTPKTDKQLADSLEQIASEQKRLASELEQSLAKRSTQVSNESASNSSEGSKAVEGASGQTSTASTQETESQGAEALANNKKNAEEIKPETRQQDLVERVRAIETGLSQELKRSALVTERFADNIRAMDKLTGKLRGLANAAADEAPSSDDNTAQASDTPSTEAAMASTQAAATAAHEISDELRELATHISALAQTEPANRIAALRDMTSTLSNMESEVGRSVLKTVKAAEKSKPQSALAKSSVNGVVSPEDDSDIDSKLAETTDGALAQARQSAARLGRRLGVRASTVEDVLKTAPDLGSLEANEINARIQKFVADNEFLEDLANSRSALGMSNEEKETESWVETASGRASEYADAALQLDSMYRQLVTPRTDQLRKLEETANQLSKALSQQPGVSGESTETKKKGKGGSVESLKRELEKGLKEAELDDLLEALTSAEEQELASPSAGDGVDPAFLDSKNTVQPSKQFSANQRLAVGVTTVQKELRSRIQELILLEIAADRDSPVPPQYRELIDGYFRTIAGGIEEARENLQ